LKDAILGLLPFSTELDLSARSPDGVALRAAVAELKAEFVVRDVPMAGARVLIVRGHQPSRPRGEEASLREEKSRMHRARELLV